MQESKLTTYSNDGLVITGLDASVVQKLADIATGGETTPTPVPAIGTYWAGEGGVYAGVMRGEDGLPDYHLIVPVISYPHPEAVYGSPGFYEIGAARMRDGQLNTRHLTEVSTLSYPAAKLCSDMVFDGKDDLYLPAISELALCKANVPELFEELWYLSSTQASDSEAYYLDFRTGLQGRDGRLYSRNIHPVRRKAL